MYKDYLYYDDESEYLKRYYRSDEVPPRLINLSKFYSNTSEGLTKPNLAVHEQNKIILKRNHKLHKYYLSKLENFADIPQTQRNHKGKEDFKILQNLHDDEDYSEDVYNDPSNRRKENHEKEDDDNEGVVNGSFQQMLERYENATAKISFESEQHNVYDPDYSTDSPKMAKSPEDNVSFDRSLENYAKSHGKDFPLFDKKTFGRPKGVEKIEKINYEVVDMEDQIPHNLSDFAFSDASEINVINEIIKSSKDDIIDSNYASSIVKEALTHSQKHNKRVTTKENEEKEKDKHKFITTQKLNSAKLKQNTAKHVPNKQSESFSRKKASMDKVRISKEMTEPSSARTHDFHSARNHDFNIARSQEINSERTLKSSERYISKSNIGEKGETYSIPSMKRDKEDDHLKTEHSARNIEFFEKLSPRDMQYPIISIKNIQINQIKPIEIPKDIQHYEKPPNMHSEGTSSNKNRKSTPQTGKKNSGSYKKLSIPGDAKPNVEKPVVSTTSIQYIKGLMEKYQKFSDDAAANNKNKAAYDKFKDTTSNNKNKGMHFEESNDKHLRIDEIYSSSDLYSRVAKKAEPRTHHLSRSKTEDALLKEMSSNKLKKPSKESPNKMDNHPNSARRIVVSPTNGRKEKAPHRFGSNEGISPRLMTMTNHKFTTQLSSENSKLMHENLTEERAHNTNGSYKTVKVEKVFAYKRSEMKPPMKTNPPKNEGSHSNSSNTRRLTAAQTYSGGSSVEKNDLIISMPVSPTKRFDLKLNLNRLNQIQGKYPNETNTENSYGFWTSRSAKLASEEEFKYLKQSGAGSTEDRYKYDSLKKEYLLKKNYEPYLDTKKKGKITKKGGGSFGNATPTATAGVVKTRESEVSKNGKHLKSAAHEIDMHQIHIQDLNEIHSAGRLGMLRDNDLHTEGYIYTRNDNKREHKK